jgi:hypothetical protein
VAGDEDGLGATHAAAASGEAATLGDAATAVVAGVGDTTAGPVDAGGAADGGNGEVAVDAQAETTKASAAASAGRRGPPVVARATLRGLFIARRYWA